MKVRDYTCSACGAMFRDQYVDDGVINFSANCPTCGAFAEMQHICNGGLKVRYRENDWPSDPLFYSGQTDCTVQAYELDEDGNEVPAQLLDGGAVHDLPRFADPDLKAERVEKSEYKYRREHGRSTLFFPT